MMLLVDSVDVKLTTTGSLAVWLFGRKEKQAKRWEYK